MDAQFKVPQIPLVTTNSFDKKTEIKRKNSNKSSGPISQTKSVTQQAVGNVTDRKHSNGHLNSPQTIAPELGAKSSQQNKTKSINLLPARGLPKLCPSCSQILIEYLTPLENYISQIISLAGNSQNSPSSDFYSVESHNSRAAIKPQKDGESSLQTNTSQNEKHSSVVSQESHPTGHNHYSVSSRSHVQSVPPTSSLNEINQKSYVPINQFVHNSNVSQENNDNYSNKAFEASHVEQQNNTHFVNVHVQANSHNQAKPFEKSNESTDYFNEVNLPQGGTQNKKPSENSRIDAQSKSTNYFQNVESSSSQSTQVSHSQSVIIVPEQHNEIKSSKLIHNTEQPKVEAIQSESQIENNEQVNFNESQVHHRSAVQPNWPENEHPIEHFEEHFQTEDVSTESCPYAYLTIAYNNLSAMNAILLANSIQLYNNKVLSILENDNLLSKKIVIRYHIPTVILVCDSISNELRNIIYQVFDKVIESKYQDAVLLNDESLGIQQYKIHLWKELAFQYEKCIFLESFTMVVGQVSNLFMECRELSACVDCLFPDNFDCSVFVFEPNMDTYKELLKYGLQLKLNEGNEDTLQFDTLDEMALLNQFFAPKWKKLSFIYNFVRNDLTYTQVPAYFKYGDNIRVVNFGNTTGQHLFYSSPQNNIDKFNSPLQPWNYKFDLSKAQLEEEPFQNAQMDNYCKFYLRCFIRRVWPLLSQTITPYLLSHHNGRNEWTIFELIQILGRGSGTESIAFEQNPVTLRRKKSWAVEHTLKPIESESSQKATDENIDIDLVNLAEQDHMLSVELDQQTQHERDDELSRDSSEDNIPDPLLNEKGKRQWEDGRVDWMGEHQSDKIINRLKTMIKK